MAGQNELSDEAVNILRLEIAKQAAKDFRRAYENFKAEEKKREKYRTTSDAKFFDARAKLEREEKYLRSPYFELLIGADPSRLIRLLKKSVDNEQKYL